MISLSNSLTYVSEFINFIYSLNLFPFVKIQALFVFNFWRCLFFIDRECNVWRFAGTDDAAKEYLQSQSGLGFHYSCHLFGTPLLMRFNIYTYCNDVIDVTFGAKFSVLSSFTGVNNCLEKI